LRGRRALLGTVIALLILAEGAYGAAGAGYYVTHDFYALYSGSRLLVAGIDPYDELRWCIETKGLTPDVRNSAGQALCHVRYAYPLWTAVVLLPLGVLPLAIASSLWLSACIAIAIAGMRWSVLAARVPARWLPAYALLILGQMNGALMAIVGLATLGLSCGREARAGIALGLAALKPNVLPVFGIAVVARAIAERRVRLLVTAAGALARRGSRDDRRDASPAPRGPSEGRSALGRATHARGARAGRSDRATPGAGARPARDDLAAFHSPLNFCEFPMCGQTRSCCTVSSCLVWLRS